VADHQSSAVRLYVLCGLPFSGKTTLARQLASQLDLVHIEVDAVHQERGLLAAGQPIERADRFAAYLRSLRRTASALQQGRSDVFDATSHRREHREQLRRLAKEYGAMMTVIYLDVPREEIVRRRAEIRRSSARPDVPEMDFDRVVQQFQPPLEREGAIRYAPGEPVEAWLMKLSKN
jgi:predicted kinase